jgi:hypothetical protein
MDHLVQSRRRAMRKGLTAKGRATRNRIVEGAAIPKAGGCSD